MKKISLLTSGAALIIIVVVGFVPYNKQEAVNVNASYFNCYRELITIQNWKNWLPEVHELHNSDSSLYQLIKFPQGIKLAIPGTCFLIRQDGSAKLLVKKINDIKENDYSFTIIPGGSVVSTTIIVDYKTTIVKSIFQPNVGLEKTAINDFKKFMESVTLYYGFDIEKDFVNEKKLIVKRKTIDRNQIYFEAAKMQKELLEYIRVRNLIKTGSLMVQYNIKNGDSLQMMVGMPVNKQVAGNKEFIYMYIPATTVVTAGFDGKYKDKKKIYSAITNYVQDKYLHIKIAPYEEYRSGFPDSDNDVADFRLIYAIF